MSFESIKNVPKLESGTPKGPSIVFAYLKNCGYSVKAAPKFAAYAQQSPIDVYTIDVEKYPLNINAVPVIIAVDSSGNVEVQNPDLSLEQQLKKGEQFAMKNK